MEDKDEVGTWMVEDGEWEVEDGRWRMEDETWNRATCMDVHTNFRTYLLISL